MSEERVGPRNNLETRGLVGNDKGSLIDLNRAIATSTTNNAGA